MIYNLTKKKILSRKPFYARGIFIRGRGMIGRDFNDFDAMIFECCKCIHTCFMSIKIDVIFADRENRICKCVRGLTPWVPFAGCKNAFTVMELPEGAIDRSCSAEGDVLDLNAEVSEDTRKKLRREKFIHATETAIPFG